MSNTEQRISDLEMMVEELQIDLHASKVAITALSTVINSMCGEPGALGKAIQAAIDHKGTIDFDREVPDGYQEKFTKKVTSLLAKED